jgi:uncharacterized membrane protein YdbT with pleckstrin-like domain
MERGEKDVSYVDRHLQPGETVIHRTAVHWIVYVPAAVFLAAAVGAAVAQVNPIAIAILLAVALVFWLNGWIRRLSTELAVTDRRVITKVGLIRRTTMEMNLSKVESVVVDQGILGRILDFGTVVVKGTGGGTEPLSNIDRPLDFRSRITAG